MKKLCIISALILTILPSYKHEEGMFPLSYLNQIDFDQAGFRIKQKDIYNPDGIALNDALVRLCGCTGSFVSTRRHHGPGPPPRRAGRQRGIRT